MLRSLLEARVYEIIDRVKNMQPVEDDSVEMKAVWIDSTKAARLLAGHANAVRGEPITWIMGIDEKAGAVPGVPQHELSNWHSALIAQFSEGVAPDLRLHVTIPYEAVTVVAMYFETDRSPYVVKNPAGGSITYEVPLRKGTSTYSATRSDLLRLLSPLRKLPRARIIDASVQTIANTDSNRAPQARVTCILNATLYFIPSSTELSVIESRHTRIWFEAPGMIERTRLSEVSFSQIHGSAVEAGQLDALIRDPGAAAIRSYKHMPMYTTATNDQPANLKIEFRPIDAERTISLDISMQSSGKQQGNTLNGWWYRETEQQE